MHCVVPRDPYSPSIPGQSGSMRKNQCVVCVWWYGTTNRGRRGGGLFSFLPTSRVWQHALTEMVVCFYCPASYVTRDREKGHSSLSQDRAARERSKEATPSKKTPTYSMREGRLSTCVHAKERVRYHMWAKKIGDRSLPPSPTTTSPSTLIIWSPPPLLLFPSILPPHINDCSSGGMEGEGGGFPIPSCEKKRVGFDG